MRMNGGYLFRVCCSNRADRCHLFAETQRQLSKIYVIACLSLAVLTTSSLLCVGRVGFSWWRLLSWQSRNSGRTGSLCVVCGLSCPAACGNFPDQGSTALAGRFLTTREALKGSFIVKKGKASGMLWLEVVGPGKLEAAKLERHGILHHWFGSVLGWLSLVGAGLEVGQKAWRRWSSTDPDHLVCGLQRPGFGFPGWLLRKLWVRDLWAWCSGHYPFVYSALWHGQGVCWLQSQLQMTPKGRAVMKALFLNCQARDGPRRQNFWARVVFTSQTKINFWARIPEKLVEFFI